MILASRLGLGIGLATILLLGSASAAHAQYYQAPPPGYYAPPPRYAYPPPPPPPRRYGMYREGLVVGFALGVGGISASGCAPGYCGGAVAGEFHIGGMLNPRLALMLDVSGNERSVAPIDGELAQSFWTAAFQYWALEQLWFKAGVGIAHSQVWSNFDGTLVFPDETAFGLLLGAGVEVLQVGNMALDLQFRFGHGFYDTGGVSNYAFLVGLSWY
jgi:hypothetical protein